MTRRPVLLAANSVAVALLVVALVVVVLPAPGSAGAYPARLGPPTAAPAHPLRGTVTTLTGVPLPGAVVTAGAASTVSGPSGDFAIAARPGLVVVTRPAWATARVWWDGKSPLQVRLRPAAVKALRVISGVAGDPDRFAAILDLARRSTVDALVFDTKDEDGTVHYRSDVADASAPGAARPTYEPQQVLGAAAAAGLYTIARVVVFHDPIRAAAHPELRAAGVWLDPTRRETWGYPLALAVEACRLGFDEVQFDYVRFPTGRSAAVARYAEPVDERVRVATITEFLSQARERLHAEGCAVGADVFAIVMSTRNDQGIGQRPEDLSAVVDVLSPMIYPSHYDDGWLGFAKPNDHPGPVTADALDGALARVAPTAVVRPWLQAFSYTPDQVAAGIAEAERRGLGWMLWESGSRFSLESLPLLPERRALFSPV